MRAILRYIRAYSLETDKRIFWTAACLMAAGIFFNYRFDGNGRIRDLPEAAQYVSWYLIFAFALSLPYLLAWRMNRARLPSDHRFYALLLLAPLLFSWKMVYLPQFSFSSDPYENVVWNSIAYWPFKLIILFGALLAIWHLFDRQESLFGLKPKALSLKPYWIMLLLMVPLITAAATRPDFLEAYPKLKLIQYPEAGLPTTLQKILFELSYGSDFLGIELFFRGFLVLAFARWVGKDAILPMALFYCTIHFGKPMGECISSFFGGLLLGIVTYHTRSIWGGLIVHLGIAWLMELGGFIGNMKI